MQLAYTLNLALRVFTYATGNLSPGDIFHIFLQEHYIKLEQIDWLVIKSKLE